jgi:hypothetical protein
LDQLYAINCVREIQRLPQENPQDLARDLFIDQDWQFLDEDEESEAAVAAAVRASLSDNPSAGAVMRHSFLEQHRSSLQNSEKTLQFDKISVQYIGSIRAANNQ